jgi:hypothetical protein
MISYSCIKNTIRIRRTIRTPARSLRTRLHALARSTLAGAGGDRRAGFKRGQLENRPSGNDARGTVERQMRNLPLLITAGTLLVATGAAAKLKTPSPPFGAAAKADPSTSWMSYVRFDAGKLITAMNVTVVVPDTPKEFGASPSFWFGLQTAKGDGALIQPILAWGQTYHDGFGIFHEVFDWNDGHDSRSPESYRVYPGDVLTQSVTYKPEDNSYDMYIASRRTGKSIAWNYALERKQAVPETTAFIVVEHKPQRCAQFPPNGNVTFSGIYVEVEGKPVRPRWEAAEEKPGCHSVASVLDESTVLIKWDAASNLGD